MSHLKRTCFKKILQKLEGSFFSSYSFASFFRSLFLLSIVSTLHFRPSNIVVRAKLYIINMTSDSRLKTCEVVSGLLDDGYLINGTGLRINNLNIKSLGEN